VRSGSTELSSVELDTLLDRLLEVAGRASRDVAALTGDFDAIVAASTQSNADDEHDPEGSTIAFERAQVSSLIDRARAAESELAQAFGRWEAGTYGYCEICGDRSAMSGCWPDPRRPAASPTPDLRKSGRRQGLRHLPCHSVITNASDVQESVEQTWRPLRRADVAALTELMAAAEAVDCTDERYDEDDVVENFMSGLVDLEDDTRLVWEGENLIGYADVFGQRRVREVHSIWLGGTVHPDHRRQGLGRQLLRWQLDRAEQLHTQRHPTVPANVMCNVTETNVGLAALAKTEGLEEIRFWFEMVRALENPDPPLPPVQAPRGVRIEATTLVGTRRSARRTTPLFMATSGPPNATPRSGAVTSPVPGRSVRTCPCLPKPTISRRRSPATC